MTEKNQEAKLSRLDYYEGLGLHADMVNFLLERATEHTLDVLREQGGETLGALDTLREAALRDCKKMRKKAGGLNGTGNDRLNHVITLLEKK